MNTSALNRREFLQTAAATAMIPLLQPTTSMAATPTVRQPWKWAAEPGLWETACGDDVVAQLHAAADAGFTAFADPDLLWWSEAFHEELNLAVKQRRLTLGPARGPSFTDHEAELIAMATMFAGRIGISGLRMEIVTNNSNGIRTPGEIKTAIAEWDRHCTAMSRHGQQVPLLFEQVSTASIPSHSFEEWADVIHEVNHPLCRLSVDTYRLAAAGIGVVEYMHRHAAIIGHVELADYPGGFEPGSGTLDIDDIIAATALSPHEGLIGLRCGLSQLGSQGLSRLIAAAQHYQGLAG